VGNFLMLRGGKRICQDKQEGEERSLLGHREAAGS
jgi:hypothetical protein